MEQTQIRQHHHHSDSNNHLRLHLQEANQDYPILTLIIKLTRDRHHRRPTPIGARRRAVGAYHPHLLVLINQHLRLQQTCGLSLQVVDHYHHNQEITDIQEGELYHQLLQQPLHHHLQPTGNQAELHPLLHHRLIDMADRLPHFLEGVWEVDRYPHHLVLILHHHHHLVVEDEGHRHHQVELNLRHRLLVENYPLHHLDDKVINLHLRHQDVILTQHYQGHREELWAGVVEEEGNHLHPHHPGKNLHFKLLKPKQ